MFGTWGMGWFLEEEEEPFGLLKHLQDAFSKEGAAFWRRDCLEVVPSVVDVNWALDLQRWEGLLWLIQSNFPTEAVVPRWGVHSLLWGHVTGTGVSLLLPILSTSSWAASIEWINPIEKVFFQSSVLLFYSPPSLMCTRGKSGSGQPTRWQSTEKVRVVPLTVTFHQTWEALQFCCLIHVTREKVGTRKQNEKRKMTSLLQLGRGKGHSGSWTLWCNQTGLSQVLQEVQKLGLDLYVFTSALRSQWKKLFAGSEQSSGLLSDASWINGKGASVCPGEMHADCLQASSWLILGNFRLKCSFSFCSSVGPEIKCQILTLPQPANLVICKTQMQTLSLQLHLRSWQTQANWCCLAFSSPSLCSFAFFSSHSLTYPLLLETLLEICVLHGPAFQKEDVSCRAYSFQSKLFLVPKLHSHPMSASTPDAQNLTTSQWEGGMSCFRWGLPFSSLVWWLLRNSGSSPVRNIRGKFLVPKVFFQNVEGSPGRVQPDFKWKCLLSASFTISLQLEITK